MPEFRKFKEFILQREKETEFDVATGDFGNLVIRPAEGFHYFYDTAERRLIKSFVLRDLIAGSVPVRGVASICAVMTRTPPRHIERSSPILTYREPSFEGSSRNTFSIRGRVGSLFSLT